MLNIRTVILSVVLVVLLMLTVPLVTARTKAVSNPAGELAIVLEYQNRYDKMNNAPVLVLDHQDRYDKMNKAPITSYRSQFGECFDVPIREVKACHNTGQAAIQAEASHVYECFDVSLSELASCRNTGKYQPLNRDGYGEEMFFTSLRNSHLASTS